MADEDYAAMQLLESEEEEEEEDEEEEEEEIRVPVRIYSSSPRVSQGHAPTTTTNLNVEDEDEEERIKRRKVEKLGDSYCSIGGDETGEGSQSSQWNRTEIDGLFCPICMEAWTSEGDHHICCLPCGHLFGLSCISKWLRQRGRSAKCPQCNRKCALRDVRKLFAPRIAVVDEESQKRIRFLEDKCASLIKRSADLCKKESEWKNRESAMQLEVDKLKQRTTYLEHLLGDLQSRHSRLNTVCRGSQQQYESGNIVNSEFYSQGSSRCFMLQSELQVDGARLFDIDASSQILLLARRLPRMGGSQVLTKISLIAPHESEDILFPSSTKIIKDLHVSPFNESLALFASLGKQLSLLSTKSNSLVLSYDLPAAAWSCSWDLYCSNYMYAGLQNGLLLVFDTRYTGKPVESRAGLTTNPIHTILSLGHISSLPSHVRTVVSASSIGVCQWNFGGEEERPFLIPETTDQGVCISLACGASSDDIVVSYRPRVEASSEAVSQPLLTPSTGIGKGVLGSHHHLKRVDSNYLKLGIACATVSDIRLPKSCIINTQNREPLFATGDEGTCGLILQELPSFTVAQRLKPHQHFICDVKYTSAHSRGLLGCLSDGTLQLFSTNVS